MTRGFREAEDHGAKLGFHRNTLSPHSSPPHSTHENFYNKSPVCSMQAWRRDLAGAPTRVAFVSLSLRMVFWMRETAFVARWRLELLGAVGLGVSPPRMCFLADFPDDSYVPPLRGEQNACSCLGLLGR